MADQIFNLTVGTPMYLELGSGAQTGQYAVNLIGYMPGQSLLVTAPQSQGQVLSLDPAQKVTLRYADGDECATFETTVLTQHSAPYPYIHVGYPQGVTGLVMRRDVRVPVGNMAIMLVLNDASRKISVAMTDISVSGAQLVASTRLGNVGDEFSIDLPNNLGISLRGLSLPCVIRYVHEEQGRSGKSVKVCHGVEFIGVDSQLYTFIARFVQDSITAGRKKQGQDQ